MDDKDNLIHFRQKDQLESGDRYEAISENSLSHLTGFSSEISKYKKKLYNRIVVTDRVLTINESNYNFANSNKWLINEVYKAAKKRENESSDSEDGEGSHDTFVQIDNL